MTWTRTLAATAVAMEIISFNNPNDISGRRHCSKSSNVYDRAQRRLPRDVSSAICKQILACMTSLCRQQIIKRSRSCRCIRSTIGNRKNARDTCS